MITIRFLSGEAVEYMTNSYVELVDKIKEYLADNEDNKYSISIIDPDTETVVGPTDCLVSKIYYALARPRRLLEWVDPDKLDWYYLASKEYAYDYIKEHRLPTFGELEWAVLSSAPHAVEILRENIAHVSFSDLSKNPNPEAFNLLEEYLDRVDWDKMADNHSPCRDEFIDKHYPSPHTLSYKAQSGSNYINYSSHIESVRNREYWLTISSLSNDINFMRANLDKLSFYKLTENRNPEILPLLEENLSKLLPWGLSSNPIAVPLLKANPGEIQYRALARNPNPEAIALLFEMFAEEVELDTVVWLTLSENPAALPWLEKNQDKIDYDYLSRNPSIFC